MDGWMDGWADGRMNVWADGRMGGWTEGRKDGRTQTDRLVDKEVRLFHMHVFSYSKEHAWKLSERTEP
jgi:hypothetical protein